MLYTAFIFGLISSFHCIGMCGPIAMMLPLDRDNQAKKVTQIMTYHIGRLTAYASIGLVFGLLGKGLFLAGMQQKISIFIGVAMILVILIPEKVFARYNFSKPVFVFISKIKSTLGKQFKNKSYKSLFTIGLLNGFLPCGMVYSMLLTAMFSGSAVSGALVMLAFGLGTLPTLLAMGLLGTQIQRLAQRRPVRLAAGVLVLGFGILGLVRTTHLAHLPSGWFDAICVSPTLAAGAQ